MQIRGGQPLNSPGAKNSVSSPCQRLWRVRPRTLVSHLAPCVAVDRCSQGSVSRSTVKARARRLRRPCQTEGKPGIGSMTRTASFCNRVTCAQVFVTNYILPNCPPGCQRLNVRCKQRSPEKNRFNPMRRSRSIFEASPSQVHRVWKNPTFFS